MMNKKLKKSLFGGLFAILFVAIGFIPNCLALEGKAGEVIKTVADLKELEAKGLLFRSQVLVYSEQIEKFGIPIPIVETTDRRMEKVNGRTYNEATMKNQGKASIGPDGNIRNYAGQGQPFPFISPDDPYAGVKAAFNYDHKDFGDAGYMPDWDYFLTDSKGRIKTLGGSSNRISLNYRTAIPPVPSLGLGNKIWYKDIISFTKPFASKNLAEMVIKYKDEKRQKDTYIYVPGLRRVARVSAGDRCDALGGFVFNMDDSDIWQGDTFRFNWKFVKEKEHLVGALRDYDKTIKGGTYIKGGHLTKTVLERRKEWMILQTPKDPNYCYSKRIYLIDPLNWFFDWEEMYDRAGHLWKMLQQNFSVMKIPEQYGGGHIMTNTSGDAVDFKIWEAGPYYHHFVSMNDPRIKANQFTLDAMRRQGR